MPYTRPGVEAAVRLTKAVDNKDVWTKIEAKYSDMLIAKTKKDQIELLELDTRCEELGKKWRLMVQGGYDDDDDDEEEERKDALKGEGDNPNKSNSKTKQKAFITCEELYTVMKWKFAKGKSRPLWKHLNSNSQESVRKHSESSFAHVTGSNCNITEALNEMSKLKGVGPAGSSAILSLYRPDLFVFMDDEVIECLYDGKREYKLKIYLEINDKCGDIASLLGDEWNIRRVGKALWTAAIMSAYSDDQDLTLALSKNDSSDPLAGKGHGIERSKTSKRRKLR